MNKRLPLTPQQIELNRYMIALTRLYGVLHHRQFVKLYNRHHKDKINQQVIVENLDRLHNNQKQYRIDDMLISHYSIKQRFIIDYLEAQGNKPYYDPSKEEIDDLLEIGILLEEQEYFAMDSFFQKHLHYDEEKTARIMFELLHEILISLYPVDFGDFITRNQITLKENDLNDFFSCMMELHNHSRMWVNRGYSPTELRERAETKARSKVLKRTNISILKNIN